MANLFDPGAVASVIVGALLSGNYEARPVPHTGSTRRDGSHEGAQGD